MERMEAKQAMDGAIDGGSSGGSFVGSSRGSLSTSPTITLSDGGADDVEKALENSLMDTDYDMQAQQVFTFLLLLSQVESPQATTLMLELLYAPDQLTGVNIPSHMTYGTGQYTSRGDEDTEVVPNIIDSDSVWVLHALRNALDTIDSILVSRLAEDM
jgi:hypothetical protein